MFTIYCILYVEASLLYSVLEKQGKKSEALDLLVEGKGKNLLMDDIFKDTMAARLRYEVGRLDEANGHYRLLTSEKYVLVL